MLDSLFGSQNVQKILIFLFVNGKCYGNQLQRLLKTSLTPIQKALIRLEKGGIILSYYEGKTRLYHFNPAFPLLNELEQLLKRAYTLLPSHDKKQYCIIKQASSNLELRPEECLKLLLTFWKRLAAVKHLVFHAKTKSKEETGWNGKGKGEVAVFKEGDSTLLFNEKGKWQNPEGQEIDFSNSFRWTLDRQTGLISLEHLRRGKNHPFFLFHLAPSGPHSLSSINSLLCAEDNYFGQIFFDRYSLRLNWRVIGPNKNEEIDYYYT